MALFDLQQHHLLVRDNCLFLILEIKLQHIQLSSLALVIVYILNTKLKQELV